MHIAPDNGRLPNPEVPDDQHLVQVLLPRILHGQPTAAPGRMVGHSKTFMSNSVTRNGTIGAFSKVSPSV